MTSTVQNANTLNSRIDQLNSPSLSQNQKNIIIFDLLNEMKAQREADQEKFSKYETQIRAVQIRHKEEMSEFESYIKSLEEREAFLNPLVSLICFPLFYFIGFPENQVADQRNSFRKLVNEGVEPREAYKKVFY